MNKILFGALLIFGFAESINAQPANDACANAQTLTSNDTCNYIIGSNVSSTQSVGPITCNWITGSIPVYDVWYKFTAVNSQHTITVDGNTGFDAVVDIRSGACLGTNIDCANLTSMGGTETVNLTGLTVGNQYLIRIYGISGTVGYFNICITHPTTTGIAQSDAQNIFSVFPNPSSGIFSIQSEIKIENIEVLNLLGEIIYASTLKSNLVTIDLRNQKPGIYFLQLKMENRSTKTQKLIIQ